MRLLFTGVAAMLLASSVVAADRPKEVQAIIDKAIKAHGGADKIAKAKFETWKVKGTFAMGEQSIKFAGDYWSGVPDMFRFDVEMDIGEKFKYAQGTNGKVSWEKMGDIAKPMTKEKQEAMNDSVYSTSLGRLIVLNDKEFELSPAGESKEGDKTLVGIKVVRKDHRDATLYFDKSTGLLAKISAMTIDPEEKKEIKQDIILTDYKDMDGRKVPVKRTVIRDGKTLITEEISDYKVLDKADPKLFDKPKDDE